MKQVIPSVYMIAQTGIHETGFLNWMEYMGVDQFTATGSEPEQLIEAAARRCYKSFQVGLNLNVQAIRKDSQQYHENILKQRHGSVLAHAWCTWAFEDVSRVFTHELCRNAIGVKDTDANEDIRAVDFGISQESLRYVRLDELRVWMPPEFEEDELLRKEGPEVVEFLEGKMRKWAGHLKIDQMPFAKKKRITSALRRFLTMGIGTGIVWTCNFRTLRWMIQQRTDPGAEIEFRIVFNQVAEKAVQMWPLVFGDFQPSMVGVTPGDPPAWIAKYDKV